MKEKILELINRIENENSVKILLAVESGSREWNFHSEDSDYDVRCIHISKRDKYISLDRPKEQIDLMIENIDIVSWDIQKFFRLFLKNNPSVSEWISSKTIYIDNGFNGLYKEDIKKIFEESFNKQNLSYHYINLAKENYKKYIDINDNVSLKKYVYILRALGCVECIKYEDKLPPLDWHLSSKYLPDEIKSSFTKLVELKKSSEKNKSQRIVDLDKWIEEMLNQKPVEDNKKFNIDKINQIMIDTINSYSNIS